MYCRRALTLIEDKRFKYILIFKNHGPSAGASLEHEHSQLIALPMVPKNVLDELHGSHHYYNFRGRCVFCDIIFQENQEKERIILENEDFISFCPYISRFPFEIWVMPKKHSPYFCHMEEKEKVTLSKILKQTLVRLKKVLSDPAYNFIIHTSPLDEINKESYHWHIEIMPKLTRVAGFEWGTGFYIVPTPPEVAAKYLREVK
jgi:UDPglucose--hexose-1-phosphate uridylyltransferase